MIRVLRHQNKLNHRKPARRDEFSACGAQYHTPLISESGAQSPDNVNCNKCVAETRLTRVQERADLINWQEFRGSEIVDVEQRKMRPKKDTVLDGGGSFARQKKDASTFFSYSSSSCIRNTEQHKLRSTVSSIDLFYHIV